MDKSQGIFYTLLTLASLAFMGWGLKTYGTEGLAFSFFTVFTLGGGLMCIWERSVVRSAFSLMATFIGVAGLFLLLGHEFLAVAQILIYVGGILALILFGVMLSPPDDTERRLSRVLPGLVLVIATFGWVGWRVADSVHWITTPELAEPTSRAHDIGVAFLDPNGYVVAFELAAVLLTIALVAAVYIARRRSTDLAEGTDGGSV